MKLRLAPRWLIRSLLRQADLLTAVVAANPNTIVVLMNAGCLAIDAALVPAILEGAQLAGLPAHLLI